MAKILVSINPDLKNILGHYLHFDRRLKTEVEKIGWKFFSISAKQLDESLMEHIFIIPNFTQISNYFFLLFRRKKIRNIWLFIKESIRFSKELNIKHEKNEKVTYFMYYSSIEHIFSIIIHAILNRFKYKYVLNLFYFHFNVGSANKRPLNWIKSKLLFTIKIIIRVFRINLCTDSERLNIKLKVSFPILPMFSTTLFKNDDLKKSISTQKKRFTISFPGLMRKGKGYDMSCKLIEMADKENKNQYNFFIRKTEQKEAGEMQGFFNKIKDIPDLFVFEGMLNENEYKRMFLNSDIIFISYRREEFYARTSAVLSDSIRLNKPVIGATDTWLGDIIEKCELGATFIDGDIQSMYNALLNVINKYDLVTMRVRSSGAKWLSENNIKSVIKFIDDF